MIVQRGRATAPRQARGRVFFQSSPISVSIDANIESSGLPLLQVSVNNEALARSEQSFVNVNFETRGGLDVVVTATGGIEAMGNVQDAKILHWEAIASMLQAASITANVESTQLAAAISLVPLEAAGALKQTASPLVEALSVSGVISHKAVFEALSNASVQSGVPVEAMGALASGITLHIESMVVFVGTTIDGCIEALAYLSQPAIPNIETGQAVAGTATLPVDVLQAIARAAQVPIEAIGLGTAQVVVGVLTALFRIRPALSGAVKVHPPQKLN